MALTDVERRTRRLAAQRRYREKNRESLREKGREYERRRREDPAYLQRQATYQRRRRELEPEAVAEIRRRFADKHPDYFTEWARERRASDPEWARDQGRKFREKNPESCRRASSRYAARNRAKVNDRLRDWLSRNPGKKSSYDAARRARRLAGGGTFTLEDWHQVCAEFKGRCAYCGQTALLTRDHVVPLSRGGTHSKDNIVPACRSCNSRKGTKTYDEFVWGLF